MEKLQPFIDKRRKDGGKSKTINLHLEAVRRILRLATHEWRDERGMTWLETAPKIKLFPVTDARKPHSLSVEEQELLFGELPNHLLRMVRYKVNAGNREEEVCSLKWAWERKVPELETSVLMIPGDKVRNAEDRLMMLNRVARSAAEEAQGMHPAKPALDLEGPASLSNCPDCVKGRNQTASLWTDHLVGARHQKSHLSIDIMISTVFTNGMSNRAIRCS
jgi:hypothetical protein